MNEPLWVLLLKVFGGPLVSGLVAAGIMYRLSRRRFVGERWWERKAEAYSNLIDGLVKMVHLCLGMGEYRGQEISYDNYVKVRTELERFATQGSYLISEKAEKALWDLLFEHIGVQASTWKPGFLRDGDYSVGVECCLGIMREEARRDLQVRWYGW